MIQARPLADLDGVQHRFFTRQGGVSEGLYSSLNCGYGSGDQPDNVRENRRRAAAEFALGETDLSAHVDFASLAEATGQPTYGPAGQGAFLQRLGIAERAEALKARANEGQRAAIDAASARLIAPDQMGTLFRVLAVGDDRSAAPVGFSDAPSDKT